MHRFTETTVDEDLPSLIVDELAPIGAIASEQEFGKALFAIVAPTSPASLNCAECGRLHLANPAIWHHYCLNALRRLRLESQRNSSDGNASHVSQFAMIYERIAEHRVGRTMLDVGSNLGLLPILIAERDSDAMITGCDNRPEIMLQATGLASRLDVDRVRFEVRDVLHPQFRTAGRFDTVTAIHLLEHFTDGEIEVTLENMLDVTLRRLIVAVPYERTPQALFGHQQAFDEEGLRSWGTWCVEELGGGSFRYDDVCGGFLVVDRPNRSGSCNRGDTGQSG